MTRLTGPMLLDPGYLPSLPAYEAHLMLFEAEAREHAGTDPDFWPRQGSWMSLYRPYVVQDGVLHIPVKGMLLNDFPYADGGWATGYEYIRAAMERGLNDSMVKSIALRVDSPGGMVTGCFETAAELRAGRGIKPVVAWVQDHAYSAAYALASAASKVMVTETGGVGSIGVMTTHFDLSGLYAANGVTKTYIFKGKHKMDGNEAEPLPKDVKARIEERLSATYDVFVRCVARNRGLDEQAVRDTEALTYPALAALEVGLADRIGAHGDAFTADTEAATSNDGDDEMANAQAEKTYAQADLDTALAAARTETRDAAFAEGKAAGAADERERISAILGSEEAKTRPTAAREVAFSLGLDADKAKAFLGKLPAEASAKPAVLRDGITSGFKAEQETDKPGLSASIETKDAPANDTPKARADRAFKNAGL